MHIAARIKEGEKCAEMLVKSGADVNATKEVGLDILVKLTRSKTMGCNLHDVQNFSLCSEVLLNIQIPLGNPIKQQMINLQRFSFIQNGETALHIAARYGQLKMITALLAEGADPTWQSKSGETPLHVAVRYCHWEVADELLRFIAKSKSTLDAVILVNIQNGVSRCSYH